MSFRLVDCGWDGELEKSAPCGQLKAANCLSLHQTPCREAVAGFWNTENASGHHSFQSLQFLEGVSDLDALDLLLRKGAAIRGVLNLHAKLYLFGDSRAIATSANLTEAALLRIRNLGSWPTKPRLCGAATSISSGFGPTAAKTSPGSV